MPLSIRDRPAFRAIVLHELAHLRNGDVDLSYYAIGLWRAFLVLAMLPLALILLRSLTADPATAGSFAWRFAVLLPFVYIIRSAILRAREHDADVRASTREPEIRRVLASAASKESSPSKLRRLVAWHPSTARRVDVIDDPSPLLRLGLLDAFGIGVVGTIAYEEVARNVGFFGLDAVATRGLAALAFGPLVGIIVALGVWRQTFAFLSTGRSAVRVAPLGLALLAGLLVGQRLAFTSGLFDDAVLLRFDLAPFHVWLTILVGIGAILFAAWLVATARLWLPVATRLRSPARASLPIAIGAAAVLTIAIAVFVNVVDVREVVEFTLGLPNLDYAAAQSLIPLLGPEWLWRLVLGTEVRVFIDEPLVLVFFLLLVLIPWAAAPFYARIPPDPVATWGGLDATDAPPTIERPELRTRWAIVVGLAATTRRRVDDRGAVLRDARRRRPRDSGSRRVPARLLRLAGVDHAVLAGRGGGRGRHRGALVRDAPRRARGVRGGHRWRRRRRADPGHPGLRARHVRRGGAGVRETSRPRVPGGLLDPGADRRDRRRGHRGRGHRRGALPGRWAPRAPADPADAPAASTAIPPRWLPPTP